MTSTVMTARRRHFTLIAGTAAVILDREDHARYRVKVVSRELTSKGFANLVEFGGFIDGQATHNRRTIMDGETLRLGQTVIRFQGDQIGRPYAAILKFEEVHPGWRIIHESTARAVAGL